MVLGGRCVGGEDHPRTRGEKYDEHDVQEYDMGSPPHTRGKVVIDGGYVKQAGITPAHAGKSPVMLDDKRTL